LLLPILSHIVKSGKNVVGNRGINKSKGKDPLLFEKWICRNSQPVSDDDSIIVVLMTSTWEQRGLVGVAWGVYFILIIV